MTEAAEHAATKLLEFDAIYVDTNVLMELGWPSPSTVLSNVCIVAHRVGIPVFLPEPVEYEAEQHWFRNLERAVSEIRSAESNYERITRAIGGTAKVQLEARAELAKRFAETAERTKKELLIQPIPTTKRSLTDFFQLATNYILPFQLGTLNSSGQGKGFQDAVILASVLEHMKDNGNSGLLLTRDGKFSDVSLTHFMPGCEGCKLLFDNAQNTFDKVYEHFWDREVTRPWEEEKKNATAAAQARIDHLKEFILPRLDLSSLIGEGKPIRLLGIQTLTIMYVQTPIPNPNSPDRNVTFAIAVTAKIKILGLRIKNPLERLLGPSSTTSYEEGPVELENVWIGGVETNATVVERQFTGLEFISLLTLAQIGAGTFWWAGEE